MNARDAAAKSVDAWLHDRDPEPALLECEPHLRKLATAIARGSMMVISSAYKKSRGGVDDEGLTKALLSQVALFARKRKIKGEVSQ